MARASQAVALPDQRTVPTDGPLAQLSGILEGLRLLKPESSDTDVLQWTVVETLLHSTNADGCSLALETESDEWLIVRDVDGSRRRRIVRSHLLQGSGFGGEVLAGREPSRIEALSADSSPARPPYAARCGFRSAILLPVHGRAGITGLIAVYFRGPARLAADAFDALVLINHVASVALENASLYRTLQKSYFSTVESLANAIDEVSPATHGHSKRVTQYALILGERLELDASALSVLQYGALLHDIGKIGIPPSLLEKTAPLSLDERGLMEEHPVIGERIISPVEFLQSAKPIVRHHHEQWCGLGYPDHLRGEEIPLGARIVAIADFYDAMISTRPYKPALDPREVSDEIRKAAGTKFDPDLAEMFLRAPGIAS